MKRRIAIGDIHGCFLTMQKLLEKTIEVKPVDEIYFIGDYIDRGPRSKQVLDYLMQMKKKKHQIFPLQGNHEDMMLKAYKDESYMFAWYNNGAEESLRSFQIPEEMLYDHSGIRKIPGEYIEFISEMPLFYELDDYLIVHAGFNFEADSIYKDEDSMLWIRDFQYNEAKAGGKTIIYGHTPKPVVSIQHTLRQNNIKMIDIDAGCVYKELPGYGNLVALDLDSKELFVEKNIE